MICGQHLTLVDPYIPNSIKVVLTIGHLGIRNRTKCHDLLE